MKLFDSRSNGQRAAGDAARDARDFKSAEANYRKYLESNPSDAAIWVQLGHAVKEQRGEKAAIQFYANATAEDPSSADAYTHLAHALKNAGDISAAITAFEKAHLLQPKREYLRELELLGASMPEEARPDSIFLSVQDLIGYLNAHQTLSGIQRVQAGIITDAIASGRNNVRFIRTDTEEKLPPGSFWEIEPHALKAVIHYATGTNIEHDRLRSLLDKCYSDASPVTPRQGDTVVLLGAFWGYGNTADLYARSKAAGAKIGAYIYDLIPYTHPEYCDSALAADFSLSLLEISHVVDYFLTISEFTAAELRHFLKQHAFPDVPVKPVPLAHTISDAGVCAGKWPKSLIELKGARYVLYVSTIEGRKNHQYVVKVWQKLISAGIDVPHLAFVGRMGWRVDGLKELLRSTDDLDGRVHIVHDLSDAELSALYDGAMFTTFTSFVEGWGLPVGESLVHGKPCIASATSSIPEVGGEFVDYVNPYDIDSGVAAFRKMIENDAYRAERTRLIKDKFAPRTWGDVADQLLDLSAPSIGEVSSYKAITVPPATLVKPSAASGRVNYNSYRWIPTRLLFAPHFYQPEDWGSWMKGAYGSVNFQTALIEREVFVYLNLVISPSLESGRLVFYDKSKKVIAVDVADLRRNPLVRLSIATDKSGYCSVSIKVEGRSTQLQADSRNFSIGLSAFGYSDADDIAGRTEMVEAFTFHISAKRG